MRSYIPVVIGLAALGGMVTRAHGALPSWRVEIDRLSAGDNHIEAVSISGESWDPADASVRVRAERVLAGQGGQTFGPLDARCPGDLFIAATTLCAGASWTFAAFPDWPPLSGTLVGIRRSQGQFSAQLQGRLDTLAWTANFDSTGDAMTIELSLPSQDIAPLDFLTTRFPATDWVSEGRISGAAKFLAPPGQAFTGDGQLGLAGVNFDSPDGLYAGLGLGVRIGLAWYPDAEVMLKASAELSGGELLVHDFYRDFSERGMSVVAEAALDAEMLNVSRFTLGDGDALHLAGQAGIPFGDGDATPEILIRELRLGFPLAYSRYLESLARVWGLDGLETAGTVTWRGDWSPGDARSGTLELEGLSVNDATRGRFAIHQLTGSLQTGQPARLTWQGAAFEKLDLGEGEVQLELAQESVRLVEPLNIAMFGGSLSLEALDVTVPRDGDPDIQVRAELSDIEMARMSSALGWPEFAGTLSGHIPDIRFTGGVIEIDGALEFQVFDGQVVLSDLRVERPFGVLPSLAADIVASNLDLEELTQTFEFGRIAGRIDGYVRDLRMLDWKPVQFDAWFGTPQGAGRNDISRQAVSHLTTIGGGSATAMLSGPVLRLFSNFSYRRLGLGCRLQDNICSIRGIEEQGEAVLILEGAGLPKISIQAYNRSVDWPRLVAQLVAISSGEEVRIGD